ncbi:MAG: hypothetical protein KDA96_25600 [Planctomycetaceae bacterium]|nr:hypothetical protein [Planctomycetaceae bacterium]
MRVLGLDVGSSSIKGAILDTVSGEIAHFVSRPFPAPVRSSTAGAFEVAPVAVEQGVCAVVRQLLTLAPEARSLFVSGQMGGTVLVDSAGAYRSNYVSWRDQRATVRPETGATRLEEIRERWNQDVMASLGNELQPGSSSTICYCLQQTSGIPNDAIPVSIADAVLGRLCGSAPRMHVTHAIGMVNLFTLDWHREAYALLGLEELTFPGLIHDLAPCGDWSIDNQTLAVYGTYGDQQCALRGAGLQPNEMSINVSTGSQVSMRTAEYSAGRYQGRCYFGGDVLKTMTHLPAGRSLNVLVDLLTELATAEGVTLQNVWQTIASRSDAAESTGLEVDLAFFSGPLGSTGSITGITTENLTVGQLFRAAFLAMAQNYRRCADWLDPDGTWDSVVICGGMTRTIPLLRQRIQELFPQPLRETVGDETMLGLLEIAREVERG